MCVVCGVSERVSQGVGEWGSERVSKRVVRGVWVGRGGGGGAGVRGERVQGG